MTSPLSVDRLLGQVLDGRYRIEKHVGKGAMGNVYLAQHARLPRSYAIKVLHPHLLSDDKIAKRFAREAELAARLSHPNVIAVTDVGERDGIAYLVMELADGPTLAQLLSHAPFEPWRVCRLVHQLCDGLAHAHGAGLIHRDLKPDNIIVEARGGEEIARIADFGIALLREPSDSDRLTTRGVVLGTPHYIAPEVVTGKAYDHRADLFALGVVCYEMLAGCLPHRGSGVDVVHAVVNDAVPPISLRVPGLAVDPMLEAFTRELLAKRPDERPADAATARERIDRIAQALQRRPTLPIAALPDAAG